MEPLVYFGGALKALDDNGRIGGYAVTFSDGKPGRKDLSGEWFDAKSYLGARDGDGSDALFHHMQPIAPGLESLADHLFMPWKTKRDDIGVFSETTLKLADEYEAAVFKLVKAGKLGLSTGAAGHTVQKDSTGYIKRWLIAEISLTPSPCEPLNRAIPIKSLSSLKFVSVIEDDEPEPLPISDKPTGLAAKLNQHIDDLVDDGQTRESIIAKMAKEASIKVENVVAMMSGQMQPVSGQLKAFARVLKVDYDALKAATRRDHSQTIKGMFEDELADKTPSRWDLESVYSSVVKKLANAASGAVIAGVEFDWQAKIAEATGEYTERLKSHALAQIQEWIEGGGDDDFYLKAIIDAQSSVDTLAGADLDSHSQVAEAVARGFYKRLRSQHEGRKRESQSGNHDGQIKIGRQISDKNRTRLAGFIKQILAVANDAQALLDESQPMASEAEKRAVLTKNLLRRHRQRELSGV